METNQELIRIFYEIFIYLTMKDIAFAPQAYRNASSALEELDEDIEDVYKKGGEELLREIPGIGRGIALKIAEYIETGKVKEYEELKKEIPVKLGELLAVEGIGPKTVKDL